MSNYGKSEKWKIVYALPPAQQNGGMRGVAFVEAQTKPEASSYFNGHNTRNSISSLCIPKGQF